MSKQGDEQTYIRKRLLKARFQSIPFYLFRLFPINKRKITFTCIEGTTGFSCNPKYIALELIRRNRDIPEKDKWQLVWLVDDLTKSFPSEIKVKKNTLLNRAFALTTSKFWIDNSRKQLEVRKRKGQIYIQTWHAKLGFKPTCLDRGASFSRIAYLVSKHDSDMIDYWLSNSDWYDATLKTGSLYEGKTIRCGSPRCDILVKAREDAKFKRIIKEKIANDLGITDIKTDELHFMMYAPTFRGGSQSINRSLDEAGHMPDFSEVISALEQRFGGEWIILLRLHPQMTVRGIESDIADTSERDIYNRLKDVSKADDMYEILAGCDAFMTDYSSAAFDAAVMKIPIFLYCDDYEEYEGERGKFLWNFSKLPFPFAENIESLKNEISEFDEKVYKIAVEELCKQTGVAEDGQAGEYMVSCISNIADNI